MSDATRSTIDDQDSGGPSLADGPTTNGADGDEGASEATRADGVTRGTAPPTGNPIGPNPSTGLRFDRVFSKEGVSPYDEVEWDIRTAEIKDERGGVVFRQDGVEVPKGWSQLATNVVASKYFRGALGTPEREHSVRQLVDRVTRTIALEWGTPDGYFASEADGAVFYDELTTLCLNQFGAFNSPVWFNCGLSQAYGAVASGNGWRWDSRAQPLVACGRTLAINDGAPAGAVVRCDDSYKYPQISACFIQSVTDDMGGIMDLAKSEAMLFKYGSGTGTDLSPLRSCREQLNGGGTPSGPVTFMRLYDAVASVVKSGGKVRRAAKMQTLKCWHPDIMDFIRCKPKEEKKAQALIKAGYEANFNGEAYGSVAFQNANLSVRCTDDFLRAVEAGGTWQTTAVTTGQPTLSDGTHMPTYSAGEILDAIAEGTWECGDPGVQYEDVIQHWHTCPNTAPINSSNPCQPGFATVLTPDGIRTFDQIDVGSEVWSGSCWTTVIRKVATGVKPVYRYGTTAGYFIGTSDHLVMLAGERVRAADAAGIDLARGPQYPYETVTFDRQAVVDGWVFGDGSVHKASNNLVYLCLGNGDSIFHEVFGDFAIKYRPGLSPVAWEVRTTIVAAEVLETYHRIIPDRFRFGSTATVRSFLRGLYAANGSVCGGRITLKATSFDVISGVQEMLSSLGIRSYYTTNRENKVKFSNGEYTCKESYDLNVSVDRREFVRQIGFVHPDKRERAHEACERTAGSRSPKSTFEIVETESLGEHPVYDIEVEAEEHTYWTGGLLVSNCSEYMFLNDSACNLASINLMKFRRADGSFDALSFRAACRIFITAQEILVDHASYPTERIALNSHRFRPLGLGYANLGSLIMAAGLPYDSDEGRALAGAITALMHGEAYLTSAEIAAHMGAFDGFAENREPMLRVIGMHRDAAWAIEAGTVDEALRSEVYGVWRDCLLAGRRHGYRNSQVTVLAPTGTIAFMMDCDTTGIEPDIALVKYKNLWGRGLLKLVNRTVPMALEVLGYGTRKRLAGVAFGWDGGGLELIDPRPSEVDEILAFIDEHDTIEGCPLLDPEHFPVFDCAFPPANGTEKRSIHYRGHLRMMAAVQPFLSGAISKTVNMPRDATVADIRNAYLEGWKLGLKALAIYRDGSKESQPVSTSKGGSNEAPVDEVGPGGRGEKTEVAGDLGGTSPQAAPIPRRERLPDTRQSLTHKFDIQGYEGYLTVGLFPDGRPGELFITMAKEGSTVGGLMDTIGTLVSMGLQYGVPLEVYVSKFVGTTYEPRGFTKNPDVPIARSVTDYVFRWMGMEFIPGYRETYAPKRDAADASPSDGPVARPASGTLQPLISHGLSCRCGGLLIPNGTNCWVCSACATTTGGCG